LFADSLALYEQLLKTLDQSDDAFPFVQARVFELKLLIPYLRGDWVNLEPDKDFSNWLAIRGSWKTGGQGRLEMTVDCRWQRAWWFVLSISTATTNWKRRLKYQ